MLAPWVRQASGVPSDMQPGHSSPIHRLIWLPSDPRAIHGQVAQPQQEGEDIGVAPHHYPHCHPAIVEEE